MPFFHFSFSKKLQICWNFIKSVKKNFDERSQLGQKITKFQNLCRTPINFFLKHTIVHETKFHSFFAKQIFWALSSDTFWHFEHSVLINYIWNWFHEKFFKWEWIFVFSTLCDWSQVRYFINSLRIGRMILVEFFASLKISGFFEMRIQKLVKANFAK